MVRLRVAQSLCVFAIAAALSCRGGERAARDSTSDSADTRASSDGPARWVPELGQLLVVPSDSDETGVVLFPPTPDPRLISAMQLTLLSASGDTAAARASLVVSDSQVCGEAPTVRLQSGAATAWAIGLQARKVEPFRMDSIEAMPPSDSARFAVDLSRAASSLREASASRFSSSPFVVLSARRFDATGQRIAVAHLVRRLPQEASPLEEHTLIVAEHPASSETPYTVTHHERSEGTEETVDHYEVLAAVRSGVSTFLLVSRERDAQTVYEVLERTKAGWRVRWDRTLAC